MKPIDFASAISSLCPDAHWKIENDDLSKLEWYSEEILRPSDEDILAERKRLEDLYVQNLTDVDLLKQSAIEKLAKLGLTEEEAKAVIGI